MAGAFAAAPHSGLPWLRFPSPLIERDVRFSASGFAPRKVKSIFPVSPLLLLLARNGSSDHLRTMSAYPPTLDVAGVGHESPKLTRTGSLWRGRERSTKGR